MILPITLHWNLLLQNFVVWGFQRGESFQHVYGYHYWKKINNLESNEMNVLAHLTLQDWS